MKELGVTFKEWWNGLALREKQAVTIGASLVLIFILYEGIYEPFANHVANLRERISSDQKMLVWMQDADKKIQASQGKENKNNKAVSPVVLLSQIKKQINHLGLEQSLTILKQSGNETIELQFQKVEFNALLKLLAEMIKEQNISISKLSLNAIDTPGYVNADINLR